MIWAFTNESFLFRCDIGQPLHDSIWRWNVIEVKTFGSLSIYGFIIHMAWEDYFKSCIIIISSSRSRSSSSICLLIYVLWMFTTLRCTSLPVHWVPWCELRSSSFTAVGNLAWQEAPAAASQSLTQGCLDCSLKKGEGEDIGMNKNCLNSPKHQKI